MKDNKKLTGKGYLRQIRAEQIELRTLIERSNALRWSLLPSAITYDKDKIQVSPSDVFSEKMVEACELMDVIDKHVNDLEHHRIEALNMINRIEQSQFRTVLTLYYVGLRDTGHLMRWDDVARAMCYGVENVKKLHGKALQSFNEIFKEEMIDD